MPSSPLLMDPSEQDTIMELKKKAAAYLSDLYNSTQTPPMSPTSTTKSFSEEDEEEEIEITEQLAQQQKGKKRTFGQLNAFDLLTQSAAKRIALASGDLHTPLLSDEDFLAQAGALLASSSSNNLLIGNNDKPYKCPIGGCDKAYKNPNGLKYHNQHGHCNMTADDNESIASKPYQCTIGDCGKRYKNLNGLKYHIEHSHMAALNHTLATFGSSIFNGSLSSVSGTADESSSLF
jgi:hypothetical protein